LFAEAGGDLKSKKMHAKAPLALVLFRSAFTYLWSTQYNFLKMGPVVYDKSVFSLGF
jgi:hypothetical protein